MNYNLPNYTTNRNGFQLQPKPKSVKGFSLMELVVVMMVLIATAVIVIPMLGTSVATIEGKVETPGEITTRATMNNIRNAMIGDQGVMENLAHEPDALPRKISDLVNSQPPERLQERAPALAAFNAIYGIGWKGPYVQATGRNEEGIPTVIDGWGREIEMQVDFDDNGQVDSNESRFIRLVSAGPNGLIETPADVANMQPGKNELNALTMDDCGDDLVVFICVPDRRQ